MITIEEGSEDSWPELTELNTYILSDQNLSIITDKKTVTLRLQLPSGYYIIWSDSIDEFLKIAQQLQEIKDGS